MLPRRPGRGKVLVMAVELNARSSRKQPKEHTRKLQPQYSGRLRHRRPHRTAEALALPRYRRGARPGLAYVLPHACPGLCPSGACPRIRLHRRVGCLQQRLACLPSAKAESPAEPHLVHASQCKRAGQPETSTRIQ